MNDQEQLKIAEQALQTMAWYQDICHMEWKDYGDIAKKSLKAMEIKQRNPNE